MPQNDPDILATISAFLGQWRTASLATVDDDGRPHAANVCYVHQRDPLVIYFVSSPDSAHSRHIGRDGQAAMTIYAETADPMQIHGLQCHGMCARIDNVEARRRAWELYLGRFPFAAAPALRQRIDAEAFYQFTPTWLRWIDNRVRFGFKVEIDLPSAIHA
jgi:uncharacterized protein YhbP (UPF0306 family)